VTEWVSPPRLYRWCAQGLRAYITHDLCGVGRVSNDFATSRAHAMKRSTTGLSVRFLNVTTTTGHG
jgi:hypothetical protein